MSSQEPEHPHEETEQDAGGAESSEPKQDDSKSLISKPPPNEEKLCVSILKGEECRTKKAGQECPFSHEVPSYHKNIYICHLPLSYTKEDVEKLVVNHGKINEIKILEDPRSKRSRGVAFVHFDRHEDAKAAIEAVHNIKLSNHAQPLQARFARLTKEKGGRSKRSGSFRDRDRDRRGGRRDRDRDFFDRRRSPPPRRGGRDDRDRFRRPPPRGREYGRPYPDPYENGFDDYYDDYDYRGGRFDERTPPPPAGGGYGPERRRGAPPPPPPAYSGSSSSAAPAPPPPPPSYQGYPPPAPSYTSPPNPYPSSYSPYGSSYPPRYGR